MIDISHSYKIKDYPPELECKKDSVCKSMHEDFAVLMLENGALHIHFDTPEEISHLIARLESLKNKLEGGEDA